MTDPDYYRILQVHPNAQQEVIEAAYRRLARLYHPDVNRSPDANQKMSALNQAYAVLSDSERRAEYDARRATVFDEADSQENVGEGGMGRSRNEYASEPPPIRKTLGFWTSPIGVAVRWAAVIPGAVLAAVAAQLGITLLFWLASLWTGDRFLFFISGTTMTQYAGSYGVPFTFVIVSAYIAPAFRFTVAVIAMILVILLVGMALAAWLFGFPITMWWPSYLLALGLAVAGAVTGAYQIHEHG